MSDHSNCKCGFSRRMFLTSTLSGFLGYAATAQTELFGAPKLDWLLPQLTIQERALIAALESEFQRLPIAAD